MGAAAMGAQALKRMPEIIWRAGDHDRQARRGSQATLNRRKEVPFCRGGVAVRRAPAPAPAPAAQQLPAPRCLGSPPHVLGCWAHLPLFPFHSPRPPGLPSVSSLHTSATRGLALQASTEHGAHGGSSVRSLTWKS